jgi:hypothetical protein
VIECPTQGALYKVVLVTIIESGYITYFATSAACYILAVAISSGESKLLSLVSLYGDDAHKHEHENR